mgnify:CR=1 FL=1
MRYAARADRNQQEIINALRKAGATVRSIHRLGQGLPDLLVGKSGKNYLIEIKTEDGELTPDEIEFMDNWDGQAAIVRTATDALRVIGVI